MNPNLTVTQNPLDIDAVAVTLPEAATSDVVAEMIADGLATSGWYLGEGLGLETEHLVALGAEVKALHRAGQLSPALIGRGPDQVLAPDIRSDRTAWLDGQSRAQAALFQRFSQIQQYLNRSLYLGLTHFEAHFAAFEPGAFYRRHRDSFHGRASRIVSLVLYLNENWSGHDGGELRIFTAGRNTAVDVLPEMGRMTCFMSEEVLHEVLPAKRPRYSIACWFRADVAENLAFIR